jgi:hypothetical protein
MAAVRVEAAFIKRPRSERLGARHPSLPARPVPLPCSPCPTRSLPARCPALTSYTPPPPPTHTHVDVSQDLFNATIEYNIMYGDAREALTAETAAVAATDRDGVAASSTEVSARVADAAQAADAARFIDGLRNKFSTRAGEFGSQLSGGQKQRVAIARCVLCVCVSYVYMCRVFRHGQVGVLRKCRAVVSWLLVIMSAAVCCVYSTIFLFAQRRCRIQQRTTRVV